MLLYLFQQKKEGEEGNGTPFISEIQLLLQRQRAFVLLA